MHDDLLIAEVADNSLHMSTCGLHLSLQIEYHHNSNSCRRGGCAEWKWAVREKFRLCIFLDHNLHCLVLFCYYFLEMLLQFYQFIAPCCWRYCATGSIMKNNYAEYLTRTRRSRVKTKYDSIDVIIAPGYEWNTKQLGPQLTVGNSQG